MNVLDILRFPEVVFLANLAPCYGAV